MNSTGLVANRLGYLREGKPPQGPGPVGEPEVVYSLSSFLPLRESLASPEICFVSLTSLPLEVVMTIVRRFGISMLSSETDDSYVQCASDVRTGCAIGISSLISVEGDNFKTIS